jgi:hypothetical protein
VADAPALTLLGEHAVPAEDVEHRGARGKLFNREAFWQINPDANSAGAPFVPVI